MTSCTFTKENRKPLAMVVVQQIVWSDILTMLLVCTESNKIPLLRKLKQYINACGGLNRYHTANEILYKLYTNVVVSHF